MAAPEPPLFLLLRPLRIHLHSNYPIRPLHVRVALAYTGMPQGNERQYMKRLPGMTSHCKTDGVNQATPWTQGIVWHHLDKLHATCCAAN
eukprot:COSAG02_NODE_4992_length_4742_cov_8.191040_7_plen_90_part_00